MEKHRRRAQYSAETQPENLPVAADEKEQLPQGGESAAPRRRRRAQPPQQITQRMKKIVVEQDAPIPQLPVIEEKKPPKKRYKKTAKKQMPVRQKNSTQMQQKKEAAARAVKGGAKAAGGALRAVGYGLLVLLMALKEGAQKLLKHIKPLCEKLKEVLAQRGTGPNAAQKDKREEEFVLEAIRPQDYHGRGAQHVEQQKEKKRLTLAWLSPAKRQQLLSAALVVVALVSLYNIGSILLRTFRTNRLNAQLSERYASMSGESAESESEEETQEFTVYAPEEMPEPTAVPTAMPAVQQEAPEATEKPAATAVPQTVKTTKFHHMGGDALPEMEALYNENRDLVAWLNIPEVIDLPVVYKDNSYYLKRDFMKQKNTAGTIFLDENHPFKEKTQNLLLHGHNMKDGTMFGRLTQYIYDKTYIKNHPFINLSTLWRKEQYVIFAVLDVSLDPRNEAFFNYFTHTTFASDAEFTSYIRQLQLRSMFAIPIDVEPSDALLTLSTCLEENRLVIVARRLRTGETRQELRSRIHTATRQ